MWDVNGFKLQIDPFRAFDTQHQTSTVLLFSSVQLQGSAYALSLIISSQNSKASEGIYEVGGWVVVVMGQQKHFDPICTKYMVRAQKRFDTCVE